MNNINKYECTYVGNEKLDQLEMEIIYNSFLHSYAIIQP